MTVDDNVVLVTGAVFIILGDRPGVVDPVVVGGDGWNVIEFGLDFMQSRYRVTISGPFDATSPQGEAQPRREASASAASNAAHPVLQGRWLKVSCPVCGAGRGVRCHAVRSGYPATTPHAARVRRGMSA